MIYSSTSFCHTLSTTSSNWARFLGERFVTFALKIAHKFSSELTSGLYGSQLSTQKDFFSSAIFSFDLCGYDARVQYLALFTMPLMKSNIVTDKNEDSFFNSVRKTEQKYQSYLNFNFIANQCCKYQNTYN